MNCVHGLQLNIVKMLKCFSPKKSADLMQYQKSKDILFIYFLKRVEFNLYLQDTAKYEILHRNKKPIERRSFIQYVQFGTVQV